MQAWSPSSTQHARKRGTLLLALLLALLALALLALALPASASSDVQAGEEGQPEPSGSPGAVELPAKRTATSDTFELETGERQTRVYESPVNFEDSEGEWKPIDEDLEAANGGGLTNAADSFDLHLPTELGSGAVRLSEKGNYLSYKLLGSTSGPAEVEGSTATYESGNGSSFGLHSLADGLKEEITLDGRLAPSTLRFALDLSSGLEPSLQDDGSIKVKDAEGNLFATLPAPTIADAAGSSGPIHYSLQEGAEAGRWALAVEAGEAWLSDPERAWPVRIDPSAFLATAQDCEIGSLPAPKGWSKCGSSGNTELAAAYSQSESQPVRTFLRFNLGTNLNPLIPANAYISKANVKLYAPKAAENTVPGLETERVTKAWTTRINWEEYDKFGGLIGQKWTTPGGDFISEGHAEVLTSKRGSGAGWWEFTSESLRQLVQGWVENNTILGGGIANQGVVVKQIDETRTAECQSSGVCPRRYVGFNSSAAASNKPELDVTYYPKAPASSRMASPDEGTTTARRLMLKAAWGAGTGVNGVYFQYRAAKKGPFTNIPASLLRNAKGEAVEKLGVANTCCQSEPLYFDAAHIASEIQSQGGTIQVRAIFEGGSGAGFSEPIDAKVDRRTGGPKDETTQVGPGSLDLLTGNLTLSANDASIGGFNPLSFSRSYNTRAPGSLGEATVLGRGWQSGAEAAGGSDWASVKLTSSSETIEGETYTFEYATLRSVNGEEISFKKVGESYLPPPELPEYSLAFSEGRFVLTDPGGNKTTFSNENSGNGAEYLPTLVTQPGSGPHSTVMTWAFVNGQRRLVREVAPTANVSPSECAESPTTTTGCRTLEFTYAPVSNWGAPSSYGERLQKITFYAPGNGGSWEVAAYSYDTQGRLVSEWDPRITPNLNTTYTYEGEKLTKVTPPGQEPWTFEYTPNLDGETGPVSRLKAVKRSNLLGGQAKTSIRYQVPVSGSGAPYEMGAGAVSTWGQSDIPTDATAVFPSTQVPSEPASSYEKATLYYMDSEGFGVNTATPAGAGTSGASISTTETDEFGNVTRELTPQNRLRALADPEGKSAERSHLLETKFVYSGDGTELLEERGPLHQVKLQETGEVVEARLQRTIAYENPENLNPAPLLPTREITEASIPGKGTEVDQRVTETRYNWALRAPTETIIDAGIGHLNIRRKTSYNAATGLRTEARQPKASEEGGNVPGATRTIYYGESASTNCWLLHPQWNGLPCEIKPVAQPAEGPKMPTTRIKSYSALGQPTELIEEIPITLNEELEGREPVIRKTVITYDAAGRQTSKKISGGGQAVPKVETLYSSTNGLPETQRFACEGSECGSESGFAYQSSFGSSGTGNGLFAHPAGIAIDASGNLWVADENNERLEEFNSKGEFLKAVGSAGTGNGQFGRPTDVAIDANGNLWVTDASNNRIEKFSSAGEFLKAVGSSGTGNGQFSGPESIAIANGHIWVGDTYNHRLQEFNEAGEFIKVVGSYGTGEGSLVEPTGVAVGPGGNVWVADWGNQRIEVFSESGIFVRQFGSEGSGNGQFKRPDVIDVEANGNVFVGDQNNERVQEFNQQGEFLSKFGTAGTGAGQFNFGWPMGIAADGKGALWVSDTGNNRVQKWAVTSRYDSQATTTTYDALGRVKSYEDADGNVATTTYDSFGRTSTVSDGKGSQTIHYDAVTGLPTELTDSAAGIFTAAYDADGNLVKRGLPDGLTAETSYDPTGAAVGLTYTKSSNCGASCTWLQFSLEDSIYGEALSEQSTLGGNEYTYDRAGRLTEARETPAGGSCTTRTYGYDKDSNRLSMATIGSTLGGGCGTGSSTEKTYSYDKADHLIDPGVVYDSFGRITKLPAADAGGSELSTSYFSTAMVATQSQAGITNSFELDASLRQRQRLQAGGLEGTEVFHYDGPSDAPAWTQRGSAWIRNIAGIGGELSAIQESGSEVALQLTNLSGNVSATAALNPEVTSLKATSSYDEFGNQSSGIGGRYGWLGGAQRRTELASGVVQMGARSYVPQLGRFLSPDPIRGGSANAYDYANADPVNQIDPSGTKPYDNACDPGTAPGTCQVWLHIKMWSRRGGRMGVRMIYKSNRVGGISVIAFDIYYWVDEKNDVYREGFISMAPPHYLNTYPGIPSSCQYNAPCANNHDGRGTFACTPGNQYQILIIFKYIYNIGHEAGDAQVLEVEAQEFCIY